MANVNNALVEKPDISMVDDTARDANAEKPSQVIVIDDMHVMGLSDEEADFYNNFTREQRVRTRRKIDIRLCPMLATLYLIAHLDRANIGNTKIEGIDKDLNITGVQWNIVLSLFFVPYVLFEVPSNILLRRFQRPSVYIGTIVTVWGIIMTLHGVVNNFAGLLTLRLLLGVFEAGFFPAAAYLCTFWYMPQDLAQRIAWFYFSSAISGAFSGILAAGIAQMDGLGGYEGWRWIFIIEGILTVVLGIATFWLLIDSPEFSSKWLEPDEIRFLQIQRFVKQGGRFNDETNEYKNVWRDVRACLLDWRLWLITGAKFCQAAAQYGTKFNLPTITRSMGYANTQAQLMSAPPYIFGAASALFCAWLSDRFYWRMPFVVGPFLLICTGFSIMLGLRGQFAEFVAASYSAVVIACLGIYPIMPSATSWAANNLAPASRRAIGLALNVGIGNCGGIMGGYMFFESDKPKYTTGFGLGLAFGAAGLLFAAVAEFAYWHGNKQKGKFTEEEIRAKYTHDELIGMGNKSPLFKFTL